MQRVHLVGRGVDQEAAVAVTSLRGVGGGEPHRGRVERAERNPARIGPACRVEQEVPAMPERPATGWPVCRLSGHQNGSLAPSVPASGCADVVPRDRSHKRDAPSPAAANTI